LQKEGKVRHNHFADTTKKDNHFADTRNKVWLAVGVVVVGFLAGAALWPWGGEAQMPVIVYEWPELPAITYKRAPVVLTTPIPTLSPNDSRLRAIEARLKRVEEEIGIDTNP